MAPQYIFEVIEFRDRPGSELEGDLYGQELLPCHADEIQIEAQTESSGCYYYCNGQRISNMTSLPDDVALFHSYSVFYDRGFWVLPADLRYEDIRQQNAAAEEGKDQNDAGLSPDSEDMNNDDKLNWRRISFDWDEQDYSSYVYWAGEHETLRLQRTDQAWVSALLPDIYHGPSTSLHPGYGGLNGDLALILALVAFSVRPRDVPERLTRSFRQGRWLESSEPCASGCMSSK